MFHSFLDNYLFSVFELEKEEFRWSGWSFLFLSIICWAKRGELISLVLPTQNIYPLPSLRNTNDETNYGKKALELLFTIFLEN